MRLDRIVEVLEQVAPLPLAEDWDNVGLLVGDKKMQVRRMMLTIDVTRAVLDEAKAKKVDLIIAYHPPIFDGLKRVVAGQGSSPLLYETIRAGIAIYSLHTALDSVVGGVNDLLAKIVGIQCARPLWPTKATQGKVYKLVVFLPESDIEGVSEAIFTAGAGVVGQGAKYTKCSFRTPGLGTFACGENSNPAIGKPGNFEQVNEYRLETIVKQGQLDEVVGAMLTSHSYEEVAYDIVPLQAGPVGTGLGRFGDLDKPTAVTTLVDRVKKALKVKIVGMIGPKRRQVKRAAVAAGSCGSMMRDVIKQGCDFYLTGELKHHHALELQEAGVTTVCVSHSNSERIILRQVASQLRQQCKAIQVIVSVKDCDPFVWR